MSSGFFWLLLLGSIAMLLPFWVMISVSLSELKTILASSDPVWFPWPMHWQNYATLFQKAPIARYFVNSLFVSAITTFGHVGFAAMAAYAFSRLRWRFKNAVFFTFLLTMMIPPQVNLAPLFFLMKTLHWVDTYWALIVPGWFGAFGVFLLRQWFNGLPRELEEAATLDGCSPWQIFLTVALPLSKPALAALGIFVFISSWNSFLWPLVVTHSDSLRTLPVGLAVLKESFRDVTDWPLLMAASTLSVLPVALVFVLGQRHFMAGLLAGGLKE